MASQILPNGINLKVFAAKLRLRVIPRLPDGMPISQSRYLKLPLPAQNQPALFLQAQQLLVGNPDSMRLPDVFALLFKILPR